MKIVVNASPLVKNLISGALSAWDPRRKGAVQKIEWQKEGPALLYDEKPGNPDVLECRWSLDRDPKTARKHWKVDVGPVELVRRLEKSMSHHFDDPLDVR